jgi:hypothetical protein
MSIRLNLYILVSGNNIHLQLCMHIILNTFYILDYLRHMRQNLIKKSLLRISYRY